MMNELSVGLSGDKSDNLDSINSTENTSGLMTSGYMKNTEEAMFFANWSTQFCLKHLQRSGATLKEKNTRVA